MTQSLRQLGTDIYREAVDKARRRYVYLNSGTMALIAPILIERGADQAEQDARKKYSDVPDIFAQFEPTGAEAAAASVTALRAVRDQLALKPDPNQPSKGTHIALRSKQILSGSWRDHWHGEARDNFVNNFAAKIDPVAESQAALAEVLAATLEQHQAIRDRAHQDIQDIGTKTLAALKALPPSDGGGGMSLSDALTVVLTIAGLALAIPTGGADAGVLAIGGVAVRDLLSFTVTVASTLSGLPHEVTIEGGSVDDLMNSMLDGIMAVIQWIGGQNDNITGKLTNVYNHMRDTDMEMPKPNDADGVDLSTEDADSLTNDFAPAAGLTSRIGPISLRSYAVRWFRLVRNGSRKYDPCCAVR